MSGLVLIADDDADSRAVAGDALRLAGFEVAEAADGGEALASAARRAPDVILLDLSMPNVDGWEAARRLRQGPCARVPIVAFTARAMPGDRERALAAGCDDYLAKPCSPREVVRKASSWAGRSSGDTRASALGRADGGVEGGPR